MKVIRRVFVYLCIDYQVVINLHHRGALMSSRETEAGSCTVWNTSFLFDLPPGDISQLPLMLEFIITQVKSEFLFRDYLSRCMTRTPLFTLHSKCNRIQHLLFSLMWQNAVLSEAKAVGRVFIGAEAADAGRAHWRDMCSRNDEQARWHTVRPEATAKEDY